MADLYDTDFYAWTIEQAALLRAGNFSAVDTANIAEEIESLGRRDRREVSDRLAALLCHLLIWRFQPPARGPGRRGNIGDERRQLGLVLDDSPSLRAQLGSILATVYADARELAEEEAELPESTYPSVCPWTVDQALDWKFWPE
jgi:hypothetical protein